MGYVASNGRMIVNDELGRMWIEVAVTREVRVMLCPFTCRPIGTAILCHKLV